MVCKLTHGKLTRLPGEIIENVICLKKKLFYRVISYHGHWNSQLWLTWRCEVMEQYNRHMTQCCFIFLWIWMFKSTRDNKQNVYVHYNFFSTTLGLGGLTINLYKKEKCSQTHTHTHSFFSHKMCQCCCTAQHWYRLPQNKCWSIQCPDEYSKANKCMCEFALHDSRRSGHRHQL